MTRRIPMPRRPWLIAALVLAVVAVAAVAALAPGSAGAGDRHYTVVLDNAFGLTNGSDLRSSGVRVGTVTGLDVQRSTDRALVTISVSRPDFAGFRKDVFCNVKPQSLIGEYYMDCDPGTSPLPAPSTIPVTQTAATIPPDLVLDILRRPARERFGLILSELGMGVGGRGADLQATIRRAVPALRETDQVLQILGDNRRTLQQLTHDADRVLAALAHNRDNVARFVKEAGDTTTATAKRKVELAATVHRLPAFLAQLRPTLRDLGTAAAKQTPALADLRAAAPQLTTLLRRLGPFADSARPAVRGLGKASKTGIVAVRAARSTVTRLRDLATVSTEPTRNLRFVLEDLNDRSNAVEPNRLSPGGGAGFTGLEALLQYVFTQSQAANVYDSKSYLLKIAVLVNECSQYTNAQSAREHPERTKRCNQWLGPDQPGVTTGALARADSGDTSSGGSDDTGGDTAPLGGATPPAASPTAPGTAQTPPPPPPPASPIPDPRSLLDQILPGITKVVPGLKPPGARAARRHSDAADRSVLDYLLGP